MDTLPPLPNQPKPIDTSPQIINAPTSFAVTPTVIKPNRRLKIMVMIGLVLFIVLGTVSSVATAIAYDKITINNPALEDQIRHTVLAMPFLPKTPRYVLERAQLAGAEVKSASVDLSFAAESSEISSQLGLSKIDAALTGQFDIHDVKKPQADLNISLTKDLSLSVKVVDKMGYLKINKIPDLVYTYLKTDKETIEPLFNDWISWDLSTLDTEARKSLDAASQASSSKESQALVRELLKEEKIAKALVLSDDTLDGRAVYTVKLNATPEIINLIGRKIEQFRQSSKTLSENNYADYMQQFDIEALVDKQTFNTRKVSVTMNTQSVDLPSFQQTGTSVLGESENVLGTTLTALGQGKVQMVWTILFDKFNEPVMVTKPANAITFPEFYAKLQPVITNMYGNQVSEAQDAKRRMDIDVLARVLDIYKTKNGRYPQTLAQVQNLMANSELPVDPVTEENYFYQPNSARTKFVLKTTLSNGTDYSYTEEGPNPN